MHSNCRGPTDSDQTARRRELYATLFLQVLNVNGDEEQEEEFADLAVSNATQNADNADYAVSNRRENDTDLNSSNYTQVAHAPNETEQEGTDIETLGFGDLINKWRGGSTTTTPTPKKSGAFDDRLID